MFLRTNSVLYIQGLFVKLAYWEVVKYQLFTFCISWNFSGYSSQWRQSNKYSGRENSLPANCLLHKGLPGNLRCRSLTQSAMPADINNLACEIVGCAFSINFQSFSKNKKKSPVASSTNRRNACPIPIFVFSPM